MASAPVPNTPILVSCCMSQYRNLIARHGALFFQSSNSHVCCHVHCRKHHIRSMLHSKVSCLEKGVQNRLKGRHRSWSQWTDFENLQKYARCDRKTCSIQWSLRKEAALHFFQETRLPAPEPPRRQKSRKLITFHGIGLGVRTRTRKARERRGDQWGGGGAICKIILNFTSQKSFKPSKRKSCETESDGSQMVMHPDMPLPKKTFCNFLVSSSSGDWRNRHTCQIH